ncbi:unnamed protein product [Cylicocyclus nassatus]|uniref:SCP domain-containing protein n=1 Tax=Cylicocyclus nassatus TaxID=53992 RepID=A0AA36M9D4_CYLNA|nr:unnamed protein product [Cylicocyclus nassatus]
MSGLKYLATLICFILPVSAASDEDAAYCKNGKMSVKNVSDILSVVNDRRTKLVNGLETKGEDGDRLPPARNMRKMAYDCKLEQEAENFLEVLDCAKAIPEQREPDRSYIFASVVLHYPLWRDLIYILDWGSEKVFLNGSQPVKYTDNDGDLLNYANLMRGSASKIGCAVKTCPDEEDEDFYIDLCLTDERNIRIGEEIYETGTAGTCECDESLKCDGMLCVVPVEFPGSSDEPNTKCSSKEISDTMRMHMQDTHNYRRSQLALGQISDNKGKPLPAASNMNYLVWDCALEREAHDFLRGCPKEGYKRTDDDSLAQNFYYGITDEPTFRDMNKKAVTEWWKQVRKVAGPGTKAFTTQHNSTEIRSFTLMGWASSREMGCSIAKCGSYWVEACRYYPPGNKVGQSMYKSGKVCSKCDASGAKSCDRNLGLCGSEK